MATIITAKSRVVFERNRFGWFISECEAAAHRTVQKTVSRGARTSRALAPAGSQRWRYANRPGYVPLKRSIREHVAGTRGYWHSIAPHARFVEEGTGAHLIYGKLKFSWSGGFFVWNNPEFPYNQDEGGAWVRHPGTGAQPFLRPAYERVVRGQMMAIAKAEYPG